MKKLSNILFIILLTTLTVQGQSQEKGVDQQNGRIKDGSVDRLPAVNGGKTNTGAGRGIDFGKGRTVIPNPVANPYRFTVTNDVLMKAAQEMMRERKLILDEALSKPQTGILISQPYTFTKGAVVSTSDLNRVAEVPQTTLQGWTRGRYTLVLEVLPLDGANSNISINARIEGKTDGIAGAEWVTLKSSGFLEQEFIIALVEKVTGAPPPGFEREP